MRIQQQHTSLDSYFAWANISHKHFADVVRSTSYKAVHDAVPITELMHKINLQATNNCKSYTNVETDSPNDILCRSIRSMEMEMS